MAHHFLSVERHCASDLALAILVGDTLGLSLLYTESEVRIARSTLIRTLFKTAIDAYAFPKLMPTTVGCEEVTSIGAAALPFGMPEAIF